MNAELVIYEGEVVVDPQSELEGLRNRLLVVEEDACVQVTGMLAEAHNRLVVANSVTELRDVMAIGHTLYEIVKQLKLGKQLRLDAEEFLRRAERATGVAIRLGQERGEIETTSEGKARGGPRAKHLRDSKMVKLKPTDFASPGELSDSRYGIYALTDGVDDATFEAAISEGRAIGALTRAGVVRRLREMKAPPPEEESQPDSPPRMTSATRRMVEHLAITINGFALGLADLDPAGVDAEALKDELTQLDRDLGAIRGFLRRVGR